MRGKLKKALCLAAAGAMTFALTACGGSSKVESKLFMAEDVQNYIDAVDHEYAYGIAKTLAYDEKYLSNELGWRTAGSDAEHKAADYLADEMEAIGLEEIEKVPVTVDKWQFNDASLTIEGTDIDIMPASYATNGTDQDGITAEIVDVGTGTAADYEGIDAEGKIVLAGVDQWNVSWINQYMNEAALHGAAAIVSYSLESGYSAYSDDMINMQDVSAKDVMPCVSISRNQYKELAKAIKAGNNTATLTVDNEMIPDEGTSYNVIGKIKGKSSEQQIIVSGHYDVYFNGFQDDSCAIGLVLAMAKAMKDSGYTPDNDIIFIAHGSEEWGATATAFDWTTGAWEMINNAHPEWAGKTLAMFNFELPALYDGAEQFAIQCDPDFANLTKKFVEESGLLVDASNGVYPKGYNSTSVDSFCLEDGVSYRASGVPHFINVPGFAEDTPKDPNWNRQRYHTAADDKDTYNADVMTTNLNTFGAMAIYVDKTPALELDLTATCDDIDEALNEELAKDASVDTENYITAAADLRSAAEGLNEKVNDINTRYEQAFSDGASEKELKAIREEGREINKTTLEAFKYIQDNFIGIILTSNITVKHISYQSNIEVLAGVAAALEKGELSSEDQTSGALDLAWQINGGSEICAYYFSPQTCESLEQTILEKNNAGNMFWGTGKGFVFADTKEATMSVLAKAAAMDAGEEVSFNDEIEIYENAIAQQKAELKKCMDAEIQAMTEFSQLYK